MTGLIVIDESGDLGSGGSRYFAMAAMVTLRPRHLKPAYKLLPNDYERKWYNSNPKERSEVLGAMANCQFRAAVCAINKNNPDSKQFVYGNELYAALFRQIVKDALSIRPCNDLRVYVDSNRFITQAEVCKVVSEEAKQAGANILDCSKKGSAQMPCIQLVDYVAGATRAKYEYGDESLSMLDKRISIARRY